jgi:hypothetical protein
MRVNHKVPAGTIDRWQLRTEMPPQGQWERFMWRDLSKVLSELWHASGEPCSAYRPDLHYMRGPGPKWHAKYDGLLTHTSPPTAPALHETAEHHA